MEAEKLKMVQAELDDVTISSFYDISDGHKNYIINGNFDTWQRGSSFTPIAGDYLADRWVLSATSPVAISISRQEFTQGQTDVPGNPRCFLREVHTTSDTGIRLEQRVEYPSTFINKTLTLSFWAKAANDTTVLSYVALIIRDISASTNYVNYPSGRPDENLLLSTSWQKFEFIYNITTYPASIDDSTDYLGVGFRTPDNASATIDFAQIKLEEGSIATPFIPRSRTEEIILCQRYYCKSYSLWTDPGTATGVGALAAEEIVAANEMHNFQGIFPVSMRIVPTVTIYSTTGTIGYVYDIVALTDIQVTTIQRLSQSSFNGIITSVAFTQDTSPSVKGQGHFVADAEL